MLRTVEEAMSQAINWWGDLPPPMKEAIEHFTVGSRHSVVASPLGRSIAQASDAVA
jgi:hypothetical protein